MWQRLPELALIALGALAFVVAAILSVGVSILLFALVFSALDGSPDQELRDAVWALMAVLGIVVAVLYIVVGVLGYRFVRRLIRARRSTNRPIWPPSIGDAAVAVVVVSGSGIAAALDAWLRAAG